jgi:general stress protein 26
MAHNHRSDEGADKLYDLIADVRICMMTTIEPEGRLASRPMYCIESDKSGDLWFFTRLASAKTAEISRDGKVNLAYADPSKQHYISISGRAEVVRDRGHIQDKWSEPLRTWFPEGRDDPQLALIRVHPERGEFWDSPSSTVMHVYGYAKAVLTGEPPHELSDNKKVDLTS